MGCDAIIRVQGSGGWFDEKKQCAAFFCACYPPPRTSVSHGLSAPVYAKNSLPAFDTKLVGMVSNPTIVAAYGGVHQYTEKPQAYNCLRPVFLPFNSRAISEYEPEPPIGQHSHLIYRGIPQTFIEFCNQPLFP